VPKILRALSAVCGAVYFVTTAWHPFPGSAVIKGLSIAALAVMAFPYSVALGIALALSSVGDVLLDWDPKELFIYGLGSFLLAHIAYAALFARSSKRGSGAAPGRRWAVIAVAAYAAIFAAWLIPSLGSLTVPVLVYIGAITAMMITCLMAQFTQRRIEAGALLFLISDSLLAMDKFKTPVPLRDYLVWGTYYCAQYLIATGYLKSGRV